MATFEGHERWTPELAMDRKASGRAECGIQTEESQAVKRHEFTSVTYDGVEEEEDWG